jgi:hypothetical protein
MFAEFGAEKNPDICIYGKTPHQKSKLFTSLSEPYGIFCLAIFVNFYIIIIWLYFGLPKKKYFIVLPSPIYIQ